MVVSWSGAALTTKGSIVSWFKLEVVVDAVGAGAVDREDVVAARGQGDLLALGQSRQVKAAGAGQVEDDAGVGGRGGELHQLVGGA